MGVQPQGRVGLSGRTSKISILVILSGSDCFDLAAARGREDHWKQNECAIRLEDNEVDWSAGVGVIDKGDFAEG